MATSGFVLPAGLVIIKARHKMGDVISITQQKRTRGLHILQEALDSKIDKVMRAHKGPVSCKAGCGGCCQQWVGVTQLEAKAALQEAKRINYTIDMAELDRQAAAALEPGMTQQRWFGNRCVFLTKDQNCAVYRRRPIICRGTLVSSDPAICSQPDGMVRKYDLRKELSDAYMVARVEHYKQGLSDIIGPLPLMIKLEMTGHTPDELANKIGNKTGVIGLDLSRDSSSEAKATT